MWGKVGGRGRGCRLGWWRRLGSRVAYESDEHDDRDDKIDDRGRIGMS